MTDIHGFYARFVAALFRLKYSPCFSQSETMEDLMSHPEDGSRSHSLLLKEIRVKTWHRTVVDQNTVPTMGAIEFNSKRCTLVLNKIRNAILPYDTEADPCAWGWSRTSLPTGNHMLVPTWDTDVNKEKFRGIMKSAIGKCGCKKTGCNPK